MSGWQHDNILSFPNYVFCLKHLFFPTCHIASQFNVSLPECPFAFIKLSCCFFILLTSFYSLFRRSDSRHRQHSYDEWVATQQYTLISHLSLLFETSLFPHMSHPWQKKVPGNHCCLLSAKSQHVIVVGACVQFVSRRR